MREKIKRVTGRFTVKQMVGIVIALAVTLGFTLYTYGIFAHGSVGDCDSFRIWSTLCVCVLFALMWGFILYIMRKEVPVHRIYLVLGLVFGIIYLFLIPPLGTPDEPEHFKTAYHVSNMIMGTTCEGEGTGFFTTKTCGTAINMRECDQETQLDPFFNRLTYNYMFEHLLDPAGSTVMTPSEDGTSTIGILYVISALGLTVGRLFSLNSVAMLLLASAVNMVFFVMCAYYSIKRVPFAKMAFMTIALLPMVLQQTSSLSYDNMILSMSFLIISLSLSFAFDRESVKKRDYFIFAAAVIMLCFAKGGVYIFLIFLPLVFLMKREWMTPKRVGIALGICAVVVVAGICYVIPRLSDQGAYIAWAGENARSLSKLVHSPNLLVSILFNTFVSEGSALISGMLGANLGWQVVGVPVVLVFAILAIAILGVFPNHDGELLQGWGQKIGMLLISLLSIGACAMAMLLYWTPGSEFVIHGLQGRYFLPVLPLILLCFRTRMVKVDIRAQNWLILFLLFCQFGCIFYINYGMRSNWIAG